MDDQVAVLLAGDDPLFKAVKDVYARDGVVREAGDSYGGCDPRFALRRDAVGSAATGQLSLGSANE